MSIFAKCNLYMYIHMYTYILKNIYVFHNIQMFKSYVCIHNTYVHKWDWKWSATSLASLPMVSCLARAWKWNFPPDIMIDRPTNQPTNWRTDKTTKQGQNRPYRIFTSNNFRDEVVAVQNANLPDICYSFIVSYDQNVI